MSDNPQPTDVTPTEPATSQTPEPTSEPTLLNQDSKPSEPAAAPESYSDFTFPEGFEADKDALAEATGVFKKLGIPQEGAQQLVDLYAKQIQEAIEAPTKLWLDTQEKWKSEVKADPEIGGKLDQVKNTVARAIDGLGDPKLAKDFRAAMDYTGAGNNPAFIRALYKLAQKVTEGGIVTGGGPSVAGQRSNGAARPDIGTAIYGPSGPISGRRVGPAE